jgi:uncharacterized protein with gpF-like domain
MSESVLQELFCEWQKRMNCRKSQTDKQRNKSETIAQNDLDKNSRQLLKNILITNKRYQKEEIPLNYEYNEETRQFEDVDVLKKITPFVTNKSELLESLESERHAFIMKSKT